MSTDALRVTTPVATALDITWLVDNADAWRAVLASCRAAHTSIWMTQLAFDADCVAYLPDDAVATEGEAREMRVADVLLDATRERGVDVRILLNSSFLLDTATALRAHFAAAGADTQRLRIRGIDRFPQLLHAKLVVVDEDTAFIVGSPFVNGYWDDCAHHPTDARRPQRELGGRPLHDLTTQVRGEVVASLARVFTELWNGADDVADDDAEVLTTPAPVTTEGLRVLASAPRPRHAGQPRERTSILPALLDGIASAERLVYVEHQYLSSIPVIEALCEVLERRPTLEVILVLNQNPDVTAYRGWQNRRLAEAGLFAHPRVGVFSLWTAGPGTDATRTAINQVFIHSKVVAVDDRWALVGSANLDGVSLATYGDDFSGWLGQRVFRGVRNFDVAMTVAGTPGSDAAAAVRELRTALWREHLDAPALDATAEPAGGWLAWWRHRAMGNAAALGGLASPEAGTRPLVLPYSRSSTPAHQLTHVGAPFALEGLDVCFDPSWVEVHLSPNWVRNMFA